MIFGLNGALSWTVLSQFLDGTKKGQDYFLSAESVTIYAVQSHRKSVVKKDKNGQLIRRFQDASDKAIIVIFREEITVQYLLAIFYQ